MKRIAGAACAVSLSLCALVPPSLAATSLIGAQADAAAATSQAAALAPGFSIAVLRDGRIVYAKGFGFSNVAKKTAASADTPYAVGSISKQFTAAAVLLLMQDGKLSLNDALSKYFPQMPNATSITLRNLLNQTSGLHNYPSMVEHTWPLAGAVSLRQVLDILQTDKPDFAPGAQWEYSNTNYAVLAAVIEKVSGKPYAAFLKARIFDRLGMKNSGAGFSAQSRLPIATAYEGAAPYSEQVHYSLDLYTGAGSVVSTVRDLSKWDDALLHGRLLKPASWKLMSTVGALANGNPTNYGMGFIPDRLGGHREVWHNGLTPGAGGYGINALFPDDGLAIVVLSNGYNFSGQPERLVRSIFSAYYPDALPKPQTFVPAAGEDYAVTVRAKEWVHRLQTADIDRTQLTPEMSQALTATLVQQVAGEVGTLGAPLTFQFAGKQAGAGFTAYAYRVEFRAGVRRFIIAIDGAGKIGGRQMPEWD